MTHTIKTAEDLQWFLAHTHALRDGQITDVHLSKRRIFDERSGRDILSGSTATVVVRYSVRGTRRVAKLIMQGVTDLCILEQDGSDCALLRTIQVELSDGRLRFWFDPQGQLYVVCEDALFEEVALPLGEADRNTMEQWTFQAESGEAPPLRWLLDQLDQAGSPCAWKASGNRGGSRGFLCAEGQLVATTDHRIDLAAAIAMQLYRPIHGAGFGIRLRLVHRGSRSEGRLLNLVADVITRSFAGTCLMEKTSHASEQWADWNS